MPFDQDPELIVIDLSMRGLRGSAVVEALARRFPTADPRALDGG